MRRSSACAGGQRADLKATAATGAESKPNVPGSNAATLPEVPEGPGPSESERLFDGALPLSARRAANAGRSPASCTRDRREVADLPHIRRQSRAAER
jgi:hypothetical protein